MADNEVKIHIPITMITTVKYSDEWEQEMSV